MKRISFEIERVAKRLFRKGSVVVGRETIRGYLVPDTDGLFAVDQRKPRNWVINHIPSGWCVPGGNLTTRTKAVRIAQLYFKTGKDAQLKRKRPWMPTWKKAVRANKELAALQSRTVL